MIAYSTRAHIATFHTHIHTHIHTTSPPHCSADHHFLVLRSVFKTASRPAANHPHTVSPNEEGGGVCVPVTQKERKVNRCIMQVSAYTRGMGVCGGQATFRFVQCGTSDDCPPIGRALSFLVKPRWAKVGLGGLGGCCSSPQGQNRS